LLTKNEDTTTPFDHSYLVHLNEPLRKAVEIINASPFSMTITELGSGAGHLINTLENTATGFNHYYAIDHIDMADYHSASVTFIKGDAVRYLENVDLECNLFIGINFLHHLKSLAQYQRCLRAMAMRLASNGYAILTLPSVDDREVDSGCIGLTRKEIEREFQDAGFVVTTDVTNHRERLYILRCV